MEKLVPWKCSRPAPLPSWRWEEEFGPVPVLIGAYFTTTLLLIFFFFFFLQGMTIFSLYYTPTCICDTSGCQSETVRRRFCHSRCETSGAESGFIGFNFLLFCNANRSSRNVNVDAGCRGTLQTPGDVACEAQSDFSCCTLVALSSTKPQESLNSWSKKWILKGCIDLKFDWFLFHPIFSFNDPAFNSMYKRIFTWMCGCSKVLASKV